MKHATSSAGILITGTRQAVDAVRAHLERLGLSGQVMETVVASGIAFLLAAMVGVDLMLGADTLLLYERFCLDPLNDTEDLEREILLAMLMSPLHFEFRDEKELASAVRIRKNIVSAARKTALAFDTTAAAERPADYWTYSPANGFTIRPGKSMIDALRQATQPDISGTLYDFSCYRATEYVFLLGLAQELAICNPALLARLQKQWETRAIQSGLFHETFLIEYGSMEHPLPPRFYVPGDRLWFRNPDDRSSDITGYEGSWVFYLGRGQFSNFWKQNRPYTLTSKCLEIYHWRHGVRQAADDRLWMDETEVDARVAASQADPDECARITARMMRWRDPQGVYADGGCIDTTREYARPVCHHVNELPLPNA